MNASTQPSTMSQTVPFYRRWWFIALLIIILLGMASTCVNQTPSSSPSATASSEPSPFPSVTAEEQVTVPDLTGMKGDAAVDALKAAGFSSRPDWKDVDGEESVWSPANWSVVSQDPAAGASVPSSTTITLTVNHDSKDEAEQRATAEGKVNSQGLRAGTAAYWCGHAWEETAQKMYPSLKVKAHDIMGIMANELGSDDRFFVKMSLSVGEADYTIECYVGGSDDNPTVEPGNIY